ncbi:MAG TPA: carboxypeptidase regulatory-like domain-containing protein [Candidatus Sulfopaludibacter sp.]|nr:carboxypeptidase regulatory-like domain-containing protein [Candidatus Sulfopaludibacter sp.]
MPLVHLFLGFLFFQAPRPASVAGVVTNSATGAPVRKAHLTFQSTDRTYNTTTDASGRFSIGEVAPGSYNARAESEGYQVAGQPLKLAEDQHLDDLAFHLTPSGVITGRVLDENGEPLAQIYVEAQLETWGRDGRQKSNAGAVTTDDRGEYRFFNLWAGRYYIVASNPQLGSGMNGRVHTDPVEMAYVTTWFPNTTDASQAAPNMLAPGAELSGIDIRMRRERVFHIRGRALLPPGQRAPVDVMSCDAAGSRGVSTPILRDGSFDASGVQPGAWCLLINLMPDATHGFTARQAVNVADHDVNNVSLTVSPTSEIHGQILVDGAPPTKLPRMPIRLDPVEARGRGAASGAEADGAFVLQNVAAGAYRLMDLNLFGMYLKTIRFNDRDVPDGILQVPAGGGRMTLAFATDPGEISGSAKGAFYVTASSSVLWNDVPATSPVNADGNFLLRGLPPGDYQVTAWETRDFGPLQYGEMRKLFDSRAASVTVHPKGRESVQLNVVPAADIEAALARLR